MIILRPYDKTLIVLAWQGINVETWSKQWKQNTKSIETCRKSYKPSNISVVCDICLFKKDRRCDAFGNIKLMENKNMSSKLKDNIVCSKRCLSIGLLLVVISGLNTPRYSTYRFSYNTYTVHFTGCGKLIIFYLFINEDLYGLCLP